MKKLIKKIWFKKNVNLRFWLINLKIILDFFVENNDDQRKQGIKLYELAERCHSGRSILTGHSH